MKRTLTSILKFPLLRYRFARDAIAIHCLGRYLRIVLMKFSYRIVTLFAAFASTLIWAKESDNQRPNIVFMLADDMGTGI